jgi:hypothetical protein
MRARKKRNYQLDKPMKKTLVVLFALGVALAANAQAYTVLKHFTNTDGRNPEAGLTLSGSLLYGTTPSGGTLDEGVLFQIDLSKPAVGIPLTIQRAGGALVLSWTNGAFALQAAPEVTGVYTNIPGAASPYTNPASASRQFFRLIAN